MSGADAISISGLLDYFYNRFAVTFLMCVLGVIIGRAFQLVATDYKKNNPRHINGVKIILQGVLVTVIICALQDYLKIKSFNIYVLMCIMSGIWSPIIMKLITNMKAIRLLLVNISKRVKDPLVSAVGETIDQMDGKDKSKKRDTKSKEQRDDTG